MDKDDKERLERIAKAQEQIVAILSKPDTKFSVVVQYGTGIVGLLGILAIIDVVIKWIFGG